MPAILVHQKPDGNHISLFQGNASSPRPRSSLFLSFANVLALRLTNVSSAVHLSYKKFITLSHPTSQQTAPSWPFAMDILWPEIGALRLYEGVPLCKECDRYWYALA